MTELSPGETARLAGVQVRAVEAPARGRAHLRVRQGRGRRIMSSRRPSRVVLGGRHGALRWDAGPGHGPRRRRAADLGMGSELGPGHLDPEAAAKALAHAATAGSRCRCTGERWRHSAPGGSGPGCSSGRRASSWSGPGGWRPRSRFACSQAPGESLRLGAALIGVQLSSGPVMASDRATLKVEQRSRVRLAAKPPPAPLRPGPRRRLRRRQGGARRFRSPSAWRTRC